MAALREAFEEAAILLAYGSRAEAPYSETLGDVHTLRARCRAESAAFGRLLAELDWTSPPIAWCTGPTGSRRKSDPFVMRTRFSVAPLAGAGGGT